MVHFNISDTTLADLTDKEAMENAMKHISRFFCIAILLCSTVSCARSQRREARAGLDAAVTQLPKPAGFDTIKVVYREFRSTEYERKCFYARAYVIVGSSFSEVEALDVYVKELQSLGWKLEGRQYDIERGMKRGVHERIVVRSGKPGVDIKDAVDYAQLRNTYPTIIFVRVDFMLPSRDEC
jgi:hypothetical protein